MFYAYNVGFKCVQTFFLYYHSNVINNKMLGISIYKFGASINSLVVVVYFHKLQYKI